MNKAQVAEREAAKPQHSTEISDEQRAQITELVHGDKNLGTVAALRKVGLIGSRGELKNLVDEDLAEQMRDARGMGRNRIRQEMFRRAIDGVEEDVFSPSGKLVGTRTVYSDRLLAKLADGYLPEFSKAPGSGEGGGNLSILIDQRGVSLADVRAVLESSGAFLQPGLPVIDGDSTPVTRAALPAASEVLPEPS